MNEKTVEVIMAFGVESKENVINVLRELEFYTKYNRSISILLYKDTNCYVGNIRSNPDCITDNCVNLKHHVVYISNDFRTYEYNYTMRIDTRNMYDDICKVLFPNVIIERIDEMSKVCAFTIDGKYKEKGSKGDINVTINSRGTGGGQTEKHGPHVEVSYGNGKGNFYITDKGIVGEVDKNGNYLMNDINPRDINKIEKILTKYKEPLMIACKTYKEKGNNVKEDEVKKQIKDGINKIDGKNDNSSVSGQKRCECCDRLFTPNSNHQYYCTEKCRDKYNKGEC